MITPRDEKEAEEWYRKACDTSPIACSLARLHQHGDITLLHCLYGTIALMEMHGQEVLAKLIAVKTTEVEPIVIKSAPLTELFAKAERCDAAEKRVSELEDEVADLIAEIHAINEQC